MGRSCLHGKVKKTRQESLTAIYTADLATCGCSDLIFRANAVALEISHIKIPRRID